MQKQLGKKLMVLASLQKKQELDAVNLTLFNYMDLQSQILDSYLSYSTCKKKAVTIMALLIINYVN